MVMVAVSAWIASGQTFTPNFGPSPLPTDSSGVKPVELKEILDLIDQLEDRLPGNKDLTTELRGKLFQRERYHRSNARRPNVSNRPSGTRRTTRAADFSSCAGLKDRPLIIRLRELIGNHVSVDYTTARRAIFTKIDNHGGMVECVYTGRKVRCNSIPNDRDMNTEHTWPQSKGATGVAKSDIFHLFPTDSRANGVRGSLPFGEVTSASWAEGGSKCDEDVFDARPEHRGNVARALFYFAVRYGKAIDREQETVLRQWHEADPVDAAEKERCNQIEAIQKNRNPFIDNPEFVNRICDF
jgi:endonuclease I